MSWSWPNCMGAFEGAVWDVEVVRAELEATDSLALDPADCWVAGRISDAPERRCRMGPEKNI